VRNHWYKQNRLQVRNNDHQLSQAGCLPCICLIQEIIFLTENSRGSLYNNIAFCPKASWARPKMKPTRNKDRKKHRKGKRQIV
jgi:hypothetical protein